MSFISMIVNVIKQLVKENMNGKLIKCLSSVSLLWLSRNLIKYYWMKRKNLPSGPLGIPIFGSLLSMIKNEEQFQLALPKYGSLSTVQIGLGQVIFINNANIMKKIYKHKTVERKIFDHSLFGEYSMAEINGQEWVERRKLTHHCLLMILKTKMINDIVNDTINNYMSKHINQCINSSQLWYCKLNMQHIAFNVVYYASFGRSINDQDELFVEFANNISEFGVEGGKFFLIDFLKIPKWLSFMIMKYCTKIPYLRSRCDIVLDQWINQNTNNNNNNTEVPTFLNNMQQYLNNNSNKYNYKQMKADITAIFAASLDTSSNTLEYGILLLCKYPNIQQQCYEELIQYFNHNNNNNNNNDLIMFDYEKIDQLVKFRAFVYEVLRLSAVGRNGLPKQINEDLWIEDNNKKYLIQKDSILFPNIHYTSRFNTNEWGINSNELNLNHWINQNNQFIINPNFIIFSCGPRDCVGKNFAIKLITIVLGTLILNYEFKGPNGNENFDIKRYFGGSISVQPAIGVQAQRRR